MDMRAPGVFCEVCGVCILVAKPADQSVIDAHNESADHDPEPLFMPHGTFIRYNPK